MARTVLFGLLLIVATAAAVLSFSALRDLALSCGFTRELAWLLPVVVDAGAAAGSLVWLGGRAPELARQFARTLALTLLGLSVGANALDHGLDAYRLAPAWWVVVGVSAIAPAVLGAVVHLAVLVGRPVSPPLEDPGPADPTVAAVEADTLDEHGLSRRWDDASPTAPPDRATELVAAGMGRRRLSRELDISEYEGRRLIEAARPTPSPSSGVASPRAAPALNGVPR
jgi:hypothetical protein